jgi:hypothetical protein
MNTVATGPVYAGYMMVYHWAKRELNYSNNSTIKVRLVYYHILLDAAHSS